MASGDIKDRQHPRVAIDPFVRVFLDKKAFVLRVRDLSRSGMFLYTTLGKSYPIHVGTAMRIELYDFDQTIRFRIIVVRAVDRNTDEGERFPVGFGVRIVEIDATNRGYLDSMIERGIRGETPY